MEDVKIDLNAEDAILTDGRPLKSKRKKSYMIPVFFVVILALIVVIIKLDIGKISSKYIAPKIENVPIIKHILPGKNEQGLYDNHNKEQLVDIISGNETEIQLAELKIQEQLDQISGLESKIRDLEVFEEEYLNFKEEKRVFDAYIGNMDKDEYVKYYQQMHPETAEEVYAQIIQVQQLTKEERKYSALISEMDETRAAKVLENLFQTDMDIILAILSNMETENASVILEEMDSKIASIVVKQLSPQ